MPNYGPRIVTSGLVLCLDAGNSKSYPGTGTTWNDLSGNNNNGTLTNGPTYNSSNKGGIVLDGIDDYISVTENANMRPQTLTAEITLKINSTTNTSYGGAPNTIEYILFRQNSRTANFEGYVINYSETPQTFSCGATPAGGTPQYGISAVSTTPVGQICSVSAVFDSTSMSLYLNGRFQNSGVKASGISYNNTHTLKIGRSVPVGASFDAATNGTIYSVKIYNRVLSSSEILQNYNAIKGRYGL